MKQLRINYFSMVCDMKILIPCTMYMKPSPIGKQKRKAKNVYHIPLMKMSVQLIKQDQAHIQEFRTNIWLFCTMSCRPPCMIKFQPYKFYASPSICEDK